MECSSSNAWVTIKALSEFSGRDMVEEVAELEYHHADDHGDEIEDEWASRGGHEGDNHDGERKDCGSKVKEVYHIAEDTLCLLGPVFVWIVDSGRHHRYAQRQVL
jgi:hypothetical protein